MFGTLPHVAAVSGLVDAGIGIDRSQACGSWTSRSVGTSAVWSAKSLVIGSSLFSFGRFCTCVFGSVVKYTHHLTLNYQPRTSSVSFTPFTSPVVSGSTAAPFSFTTTDVSPFGCFVDVFDLILTALIFRPPAGDGGGGLPLLALPDDFLDRREPLLLATELRRED